jgi:plastocyanin
MTELGRFWRVGCAVVVSLLTVTACAPTTSAPTIGAAAAQNTATAASSGGQETATEVAGGADCTQATKVKIAEKASPGAGDTYSFSPSKLTIQRGGFLAITNKSDEVHALISKPNAGIVSSVLDLKERQVIQFPKAGTFTVESAAAAHRAVLRVTVSGESGCGAPKPTLTITDRYSFTPARVSLAATENFAVVNESGATQTVSCTPDPGGNRDNSRLDQGETQLLAIDKPGRYICRSLQHPSAKVTIKVKRR